MLGYLITVRDFKIAEKIISNIFILIFNKFEHTEEITKVRWELKTISEEDDVLDSTGDEIDFSFDDEREETMNREESKFKVWVKNIIKDVRQKYVNESLNEVDVRTQKKRNLIENVYYVEDQGNKLEHELIDFLSTIPLWSNIMLESFGSKNHTATSSPTEAEFKNVKCVIFKKEIGIRVELFVEKYLIYLLGHFKFSLANEKNRQNKFQNDDEEVDAQSSIIEVSQEI